MDELINDPALNLTETQCILLAKNYTLAIANKNNTPPANVWNFCATGICNYTYSNGTTGQVISPYPGAKNISICQLGYSILADNSQFVEPAVI